MKTGISPEVTLLLRIIDEGYERKTWHGPNLKGSLRGLTAEQAAWRPAPGRHNIWEIAVHAAYWKYAVRRRLIGEKRGSFPIKGSNWFALPEGASAEAWRADLRLLEQTHRSLRAAVAVLRSQDLKHVSGKQGKQRTNDLGNRGPRHLSRGTNPALKETAASRLNQG